MNDKEQLVKDIYLHHLGERWQLLKYYIIIYGAIFGSEASLLLYSTSRKPELVFIIACFTLPLTFLLFTLDCRIGKLIGVHREWLQNKSTSLGKTMEELSENSNGKNECCICRPFKGYTFTGTLLSWFFLFVSASQVLLLFFSKNSFFESIK